MEAPQIVMIVLLAISGTVTLLPRAAAAWAGT